MVVLRVVLLVTCLASVTSAWFNWWAPRPDWDGLTVTFGVNPFKSFKGMPRTEGAAIDEGWTMLSQHCHSSGQFHGKRYWKDSDPAVFLLFGLNGYIAGIQCGINKADTNAAFPPMKQIGHMFQDDGTRLVLTAYFSDPATICTTGRTDADFIENGIGTGLYIQNGSDPVTQSILIPMDQASVDTSKWTQGRCFLFMGMHYWHSLTTDMDCDDFQPVFLLYDQGKLGAFGWALGMDRNSPRFEHPSHGVLGDFMRPVPTCLYSIERLSTMHIYMTDWPLNLC